MGRRDVRHGSRVAFWLPVLLVLGVLVAATTVFVLDDSPAEPETPAAVPPPPGLDLPELVAPAPVAEQAAGTPDPAKVRRALAGLLDDDDLGPHVLAMVAGLDGTLLFADGAGSAIPASTLKLLTSAAALATLGPDHTLETSVVSGGPRRVVLVGGGDPLLSAEDLTKLARETATQVTGAVRVEYDATLFSGPDDNPHWPDTYVGEQIVSPIQALWVDEGRDPDGYGRVADPALAAAEQFAAALGKAGVRVAGEPTEGLAGDGDVLTQVSSEPLSRIVEHTLEYSDNEAAEVLARHVGLATGGRGSFEAGASGVLETLEALGVPLEGAKVYDGSGLSRENRLEPATLTALLELAGAAEHPELRAVLTGLPVAGFTGSLSERFEDSDDPGRGLVRAKTGTLTGVSGLAGTVIDRTGAPMVFALLADRIALLDTLDARDALDDITAALADCRCGAAGTVAP
ncbi:D-alanyl-D-alanine carboxypeptidase/D-alanyl-D-alanine-endopeptidase [Nocardioides sp. SR21]|uniref:D-alanyl-D-alanine carboxypeptidase/D-alanyl-D-alanine endopeptidase n=1 Tax=Nocardioides sp. SR21 TaxID=2919501 RepID=UPI001FAA18EA|nr:D-alanyl-D-alanine carboxypeptidase/D-alanyl-D-alanine-endopeptidase [Nocardioides sp. SR21]